MRKFCNLVQQILMCFVTVGAVVILILSCVEIACKPEKRLGVIPRQREQPFADVPGLAVIAECYQMHRKPDLAVSVVLFERCHRRPSSLRMGTLNVNKSFNLYICLPRTKVESARLAGNGNRHVVAS